MQPHPNKYSYIIRVVLPLSLRRGVAESLNVRDSAGGQVKKIEQQR
jgi:hypothetical protein